jgi:DNA polymerase-3 subunit epsilon
MGDVLATVKLLEMMLTEQAANKYIEIELNQGIDPAILPPLITLSEIEKLPEEPGIFYIKNGADEILYIEPSKNVRREVIKFFNKAEHIPERMEAYKAITQIDYQATGHELVAKLQAYHEIKKAVPLYNKKLREVKLSTGIYLVADQEGFKHLQIQPIEGAEGELVLKFQSKGTAFKIMQKIISESFLQVQFSLLKRMTDPEQRSNFQKAYNDKIEKAVKKYLYKQTNFFIIADGRRPDENAVVWVENNVYRGFGYISPELNALTHHNLIAAIDHREDDSEIQKIIRQELKKPKGIKIVGY